MSKKANVEKDYLGSHFGNLVIIGDAGQNDKGKTMVLTSCVCGNETVKELSVLKRKKGAKNCTSSCAQRKGVSDKQACIVRVHRQYKRHAKDRGKPFFLTVADFESLIFENCHYCGSPPSNVRRYSSGIREDVAYSGVDRVDNILGYTVDNCVPCCKGCNLAKHTDSEQEYIERCIKVARKHLAEG